VSTREFDVLVLGGGLTGVAFAVLLQGQLPAGRELSIGVVDAGPVPADAPAAELGLRVVALSPASRAIIAACQVWADLSASRICPYRRMVVWHGDSVPGDRAAIIFDAAEEGVAELGYIVESDLLRNGLWQRAASMPGIELLSEARPVAIAMERDAVTLQLASGRGLRARLVVGADGQDSWLREVLGVAVRVHEYGQQAIVAHVASERPHGHTAWQRFLKEGPLALLPLSDGRCSIVWSCSDARAQELATAEDSEFDRTVTGASAGVLGELRLTTRRLSFALAAGHASRYTGMRFALIGDAAHRVHPLAGQGVNLGFLDAATLAEVLADHLSAKAADPGDPLALRRFERWRKGANLATLAAMDTLHKLFTTRIAGVSRVAGAGLALVDRVRPVKHLLAGHAMGQRGDIPRVVQSARAN
jgi:2-octaprenylphenol hydroxylase